MQLTPENPEITREDVQSYLDDGMGPEELAYTLKHRGMTEKEVQKVLTDLSSYH